LQAERPPLGDDKISLVVTTGLRCGIHRSAEFDNPPSGSRRLGYRERLGNILNGMSNTEARHALLEKLQTICGQRSGGLDASVESASSMQPGMSLVSEALSHANQVGQMLGQRAGQVRERLLR
jgi:hypothetical protein